MLAHRALRDEVFDADGRGTEMRAVEREQVCERLRVSGVVALVALPRVEVRELALGLFVAPGFAVGLRPLLRLCLDECALLFNQAVERADFLIEFGERPLPKGAVSFDGGEECVGRRASNVVG